MILVLEENKGLGCRLGWQTKGAVSGIKKRRELLNHFLSKLEIFLIEDASKREKKK